MVTTIPSFMPFVHAITVADAIETYGAYAGLAAVVGLGVLSLLYFAQAREVKRLREWAAAAEDREADLARRVVAQASRAAAAARPAAAQQAAGQKGKRPAAAAAAGGPATVAAAAAVAKVADPPTGPHAVPAVPAAGAAPAAAPPAPGDDGKTVAAPAIPAKPAGGAPPAGAPNGQPPMAKPAEIPAKPAAATAAGAAAPAPPDTGETGPVQAVRTTAPRPPRPAAPGVPATPPRRPDGPAREGGGSSRRRPLGIAAAAVLGLVVVVVGVTQLTGGEDEPAPSNTVGETVAQPAAGSEEPTRTSGSGSSSANSPGEVNVAVLNGTTVTGLAAEIARQIEQAGYVRGTVTNSPDQSRSATIVSFREGSRADALKVAQQIGVGEDAVRALDQSDAVTAGEDADVVVVVGADRTDLP